MPNTLDLKNTVKKPLPAPNASSSQPESEEVSPEQGPVERRVGRKKAEVVKEAIFAATPITMAGMFILAGGTDFAQFLLTFLHAVPIVGNIIAFVTTSILGLLTGIILFLWFLILGKGFTTPSSMITLVTGLTMEVAPSPFNALPAWTAAVAFILFKTSKIGKKITPKVSGTPKK